MIVFLKTKITEDIYMSKVIRMQNHRSHRNLRNLDNINYGGCGVYAKGLYSVLLRAGLEPSIVLLNAEEDIIGSEEGIHRIIREHGSMLVPIEHLCILVDGVLYDCDGPYTLTGGTMWDCEIQYETLCELVAEGRGWNSAFNRSQYVPIYRGLLESACSL